MMEAMGTLVRSVLCSGLLIGLGLCPAQATDADAETATYGDWTVRCVQREAPLPPCDIMQSVRQRDSGRTIMQASVAYAPSQDRYAVQIVLPLGFLIQSGAVIRIDEKTELKDFPVTRCEPQGCFVEKVVEAKELAPFRSGKSGVIEVVAPGGRSLSFPLSLNGFAKAMDEMTARNRKQLAAKPSAKR